MWFSLDRIFSCDPQDNFLLLQQLAGWFRIHSFILSALTPSESQRFLRSCIWLLVDRTDLLLSATACRIHYQGSGFSVATPPVAIALPLAVGQGGGVGTSQPLHHRAVQGAQFQLSLMPWRINTLTTFKPKSDDEGTSDVAGEDSLEDLRMTMVNTVHSMAIFRLLDSMAVSQILDVGMALILTWKMRQVHKMRSPRTLEMLLSWAQARYPEVPLCLQLEQCLASAFIQTRVSSKFKCLGKRDLSNISSRSLELWSSQLCNSRELGSALMRSLKRWAQSWLQS